MKTLRHIKNHSFELGGVVIKLSDRDVQIAKWIALGITYKDILTKHLDRSGTSGAIVYRVIFRICSSLGITSNTAGVSFFCYAVGLLPLSLDKRLKEVDKFYASAESKTETES